MKNMNLYAVVCDERPQKQARLVAAEDPAGAVEVVAQKRLARLLGDGYSAGDSADTYWVARIDLERWVSVVAETNYGKIICYETKGE